jgi:hypothetical protein
MERARRSLRENAGARMNDVTVKIPVRLKRTIAVWLAFTGFFFYDLEAHPLALALDVSDAVVKAAFDVLRGRDGERDIRVVAQQLQAFVRAEWNRLRHRFRDDLAKFSRKFCLPERDVKYWLQEHPDDFAFLSYENGVPVMERIVLLEAVADDISAQIARQQHAVCSMRCRAVSGSDPMAKARRRGMPF